MQFYLCLENAVPLRLALFKRTARCSKFDILESLLGRTALSLDSLRSAGRVGNISRMTVKIGEKAPEFKLDGVINGEFKSVSLADYKDKWLVFYFYPLDFTFV